MRPTSIEKILFFPHPKFIVEAGNNKVVFNLIFIMWNGSVAFYLLHSDVQSGTWQYGSTHPGKLIDYLFRPPNDKPSFSSEYYF